MNILESLSPILVGSAALALAVVFGLLLLRRFRWLPLLAVSLCLHVGAIALCRAIPADPVAAHVGSPEDKDYDIGFPGEGTFIVGEPPSEPPADGPEAPPAPGPVLPEPRTGAGIDPPLPAGLDPVDRSGPSPTHGEASKLTELPRAPLPTDPEGGPRELPRALAAAPAQLAEPIPDPFGDPDGTDKAGGSGSGAFSGDVLAKFGDIGRQSFREKQSGVLFRPGGGGRVVFLIDRSGSMAGARLNGVKEELCRFVRESARGTSYEVLFFSDRFVSINGGRRRVLLKPTTADSERELREQLKGIEADGGTCPREALLAALAEKPDEIYLLTDGEILESDLPADEIAAANKGNTRINVIEIGEREPKDAQRLVKQLAAKHRGSYAFVRVKDE
jgi:von Willebrand factor type A domain